MSLNYTSYTNELATLIPTTATDGNFVAILPGTIDYAEQRIYRDLDLLSTVVKDSTGVLTPSSRNFTLPSSLGRFVVVNSISLLTPFVSPNTRVTLIPASNDFIDMAWPSDTTGQTVPQYFAMVTDQTIVVGPSPDQAYQVEVTGTIRPAPLSVSNTTTYLSLYLPDLLVVASMIFISGYKQNFGVAADDPREGTTWEQQYEKLLMSADKEEARKRFQGSAWTSRTQAPTAAPPRN